ncbi:MAG: PQQ-binding-like beta-propeller repeat protein, partial [Pirellulaceae bacterium]
MSREGADRTGPLPFDILGVSRQESIMRLASRKWVFGGWLLGISWCGIGMVAGTQPLVADSNGDWRSWRGPAASGSIEQGSFPDRLGSEQLLWKAPLPGKGCSTPIFVEGRICLTAPSEGVDSVLALDRSGKLLWTTKLEAEDPGKHRNGSGSNASPVSNGKQLFVYFKSGTLAALDLDGKVQWNRNLVKEYGKDTLFWDHGT